MGGAWLCPTKTRWSDRGIGPDTDPGSTVASRRIPQPRAVIVCARPSCARASELFIRHTSRCRRWQWISTSAPTGSPNMSWVSTIRDRVRGCWSCRPDRRPLRRDAGSYSGDGCSGGSAARPLRPGLPIDARHPPPIPPFPPMGIPRGAGRRRRFADAKTSWADSSRPNTTGNAAHGAVGLGGGRRDRGGAGPSLRRRPGGRRRWRWVFLVNVPIGLLALLVG